MKIDDHFKSCILRAAGARDLYEIGVIQNLWSGYGKIVRYGLVGADIGSVVVKHVRLAESGRHPAGWNSDLSHKRKIRSYQVESAWYKNWSRRCGESCRVPGCLALEARDDEVLMVLEDLNASGFPRRRTSVSMAEIHTCLAWLAGFHAAFMGEKPEGLWEVGTYWHLDTRPDELEALGDGDLKKAAGAIDRLLRSSPWQTFVHGDAKLANFCFSPDGGKVAAVDFQYVGGGCGMKDVAYFIGSCLDEAESERKASPLLDVYFTALKKALALRRNPVDPDKVERNWRGLYPAAWTDFYRFLQGWSPGFFRSPRYSERLAREVAGQLNK